MEKEVGNEPESAEWDAESARSAFGDQDLCSARKYSTKRPWRVLKAEQGAIASNEGASDRVLRPRLGKVSPSSSSSSLHSEGLLSPAPISSPPVVSSLICPSHPFRSCLVESAESVCSPATIQQSPRQSSTAVLRRAISIQELDDESWLSSPFISLVITKFAKHYDRVRYFSADFVGLRLDRSEYHQVTDILGRRFDYTDKTTPLVFLLNNSNIHWTLLRVIRGKDPELQLFEPLGLPSRSNRVGLSLRTIPKIIVDWLDWCFPLPSGDSWLTTGISAITAPHQLTNYDCGVACLLYAEKCGQGEVSKHFDLSSMYQY